jgi:hypothetical protein
MGYIPLAVSPESITQSAPSITALATSETSARVGRGLYCGRWVSEFSAMEGVDSQS